MLDKTIYIAKIIGISLLLSFLIKYGGQWLHPQPSVAVAIAGVILPSLVLGLILAGRGQTKPDG